MCYFQINEILNILSACYLIYIYIYYMYTVYISIYNSVPKYGFIILTCVQLFVKKLVIMQSAARPAW